MTSIADAPEINWSDLSTAGFDLNRCNRRPDGIGGEEYVYEVGDFRAVFGECPDPESIVPDGEHHGWAVTFYSREDDGWRDYRSEYTDPDQLGVILALVRAEIDDATLRAVTVLTGGSEDQAIDTETITAQEWWNHRGTAPVAEDFGGTPGATLRIELRDDEDRVLDSYATTAR